MSDEKKRVPKLRFPGFAEEWEQRKLSQVVDSIDTGKSKYDILEQGEYEILGSTGQIGYDNAYDYDGDFLLTARVGANAGTLYRHSGKVKITDNTVFLQGNQIDFIFYLLDKFDLKRLSFGSGQPLIKASELKNLELQMPTSKEEKDKIANYFLNLDHLITLHQRRLKHWEEMKKGLLQKMLPKKGETCPRIRFPEFNEEWEQRKFSECYKMTSGYAFKMSDYCDTGVGLINGESIQHGIINDDNLNYLPESFIQQYSEFLLKESDIVVGLNRPITNGNLKIARIPSKYNNSLLYQRAGKIVYKIDCDKDFTYVLLSQEILKHTLVEAVGSDQPFISTSKLDNWKMMIPSDMEEQEKIGLYFTSLDHLITLHQRKLKHLQKLKKGLLQQMFI